MTDNKRKASRASNGTAADSERAAKRRKSVPPPTNFDLSKGETPESTTAYGLAFLESIRRTADKSGRLVAGYFEQLPPRKGNEDYYAKTPMPISLTTLERKLYRRDFANLVEFEAWLRRMVKNAKDYYPRTSQMFEDAERVRKAVSNYMTKTNPAYRSVTNYSSQPIPVPDNYVPIEWEEGSETSGANTNNATADNSPAEQDAEGEADEDAEGEEDEEEGEDEEEEVEEEEEESDAGAGRRKIVIKTRTPGRPVSRGPKAKPDHEYEGIPYKGLSFQQAQEKIVEEMIRVPDDEDPAFGKFEVFLNLPPRSLKDYFSVIRDPLSLKLLQKQVKGIHGRQPATGVSDFKSWAALEERASLLWDNAHFYNEENSAIYNLATELKKFFEAELEKAKAVVKEPPQPQKIKLRVPSQPQATPPASSGPKKITIVHGGGSAAATPTPQTAGGDHSINGQTVQRTPIPASNGAAANAQFVPPTQPPNSNVPAPIPSPSPALPVKEELQNGQAATPRARPNEYPPQTTPSGNGMSPPRMAQPQYSQQPVPIQNMYQPPPPPPKPQPIIYHNIRRAPGRSATDAIIQSLHIRGHPNIPVESGTRFRIKIPADDKLAMHATTIHVPSNQYQLQVIPVLAPLEQQLRQYKVFVTVNNQTQSRQAPIPIPDDDLRLGVNSLVFDAKLALGLNTIVVHVIAALPKGQSLPGGETCEVEEFKVVAQLLR